MGHIYDTALSIFKPTLHYAFLPGCPGCAMVGPVVDELERRAAGQVKVVRYDVSQPGVVEHAPVRINEVPALFLTLRGRTAWTLNLDALNTKLDLPTLWGWVRTGYSALKRKES